MFRYRLYSPQGDDFGEGTYAIRIRAGEEIIGDDAERFRVVDIVPFDETDESPVLALLQFEAV